jgi:hypothetical protein
MRNIYLIRSYHSLYKIQRICGYVDNKKEAKEICRLKNQNAMHCFYTHESIRAFVRSSAEEKPKTVKLYPFAMLRKGKVGSVGYYKDIEHAQGMWDMDVYTIVPINPDGTIDVEVHS